MKTVCLIPGDGVGQEVTAAAAEVLTTVAPELRLTWADAGWDCFLRAGTALPDATMEAVRQADAALFGATQSPSGGAPGYASPILALRRRLDLFANLRPTRQMFASGPDMDLLIVRENTEGLYSGRERREGDTAIAERVITRRASLRIADRAFQEARRRTAGNPSRECPKVTVVHKANVLQVSDGLFRECCLETASAYPDVQTEEMLVDAAAMWLARNPARFDVLVTTNLFGDILSDLAAGLAGGLGMAPSANAGSGPIAVFEPVHGSAPDIAGLGIANPIGAILSTAMMLDHLALPHEAARVRRGVQETLDGGIATPDIGGHATTSEVTANVISRL
jgi:homoisocitrate dehydrogenase